MHLLLKQYPPWSLTSLLCEDSVLFTIWWLLCGKPGSILYTADTLGLSVFMQLLHRVTFCLYLCNRLNLFYFGGWGDWQDRSAISGFRVANKIAKHSPGSCLWPFFSGLRGGGCDASARGCAHLQGHRQTSSCALRLSVVGAESRECFPGSQSVPGQAGLWCGLRLSC